MKKIICLILALVLCAAVFTACGKNTLPEGYSESESETDFVVIDVDGYGQMIVELYPDIAPVTVANFKKLVAEGFYNGLIFHRVISDFMIQGGDPEGTGMGGSDEDITGEFSLNGIENPLKHEKGVISMARSGSNYEQYLSVYTYEQLAKEFKKQAGVDITAEEIEADVKKACNSASSQFFIMHKTTSSLDGNYAAFGRVVYGLEVVDKIAAVDTNSSDKPLEDVVMTSVRFVNADK